MSGSKLCLVWGGDGTGFCRFSVLGSAEGERRQAGPRLSPLMIFLLLLISDGPRRVEKSK
jgi:hypothetical protein